MPTPTSNYKVKIFTSDQLEIMNFTDSYTPLPDLKIWQIYKFVNSITNYELSLIFKVTNIIVIFKCPQLQKNSKLWNWNNYIQSTISLGKTTIINLQRPQKNLTWKLRNGYVTQVPADYTKNFNQILVLLIRNIYDFKKCESALFYYNFLKKFRETLHLYLSVVISG